jgi:tripartite-type tricarboxylate transporter receptor subunit TctC
MKKVPQKRSVWMRRTLLGSTVALATVFTVSAWAQTAAVANYPNKPIRFIVPYPPGGPLDAMARMLAEKVHGSLGQPVIVENRAGAGGNIGAGLAAHATPDGYTLVMGAVATHAINPWLFGNLSYDPIKDFAPITIVASVPNVLEVNAEFAETNHIKTVHDLIDFAKKNPGKLNYASGGNGSAGHLSGELLKARAGVKIQHIPYQGAAPAQLALLSNQSQMLFDNLAASAAMIKGGKVRVLAVTTRRRSSLLPDVPTMIEAGVTGFDLGTWFGIFTTGGTPRSVVQKLNKAYSDALLQPDVRARLLTMGSDIKPMTSAQFADFVKTELAKYKEVVKLSGASVN